MAKVKGVKEKLHMPLYDAFFVPATPTTATFEGTMMQRDPRVIRFFVDVQSKTKLDTNLQAAGVLPSQNTFEAHALRIAATIPEQAGKTPEPSELLSELIYNSVTTLLVGEKTMVEAPTYLFPAGAGVSPGDGTTANHGEPDPMATFRFSEPVAIEPQQNFRVEMLFPLGVPAKLGAAKGPLRVWTILDGYLTRDVQ